MKDRDTGSKPAILLADDSKLVRFTAGKILGNEFDLHMAENGAEAWEMLSGNDSIQVVLSDLQMPVMDGFGLLQKIRQSDDERICRLPVIMVTGAENKDGPKERAMSLGATDFISKPFDNAHLRARVRAHTGHQRQTRTLMEQVSIDAATGLLNRQGFEDRLQKDCAFVSRHHQSLAVMLIQMDSYKQLFELIGRDGYDKVIRQVGNLLQKAVRREDTVGRAGLAQFLVSLPTAQPEAVEEIVQRITASMVACEVKVNGEPWKLSLTIGVFTASRGCFVEEGVAMRSARQALEQSLERGGDRVSVVGMNAEADTPHLSLDQLLNTLQSGGRLPPHISPDQLAASLKPLVASLPESQRRALLD